MSDDKKINAPATRVLTVNWSNLTPVQKLAFANGERIENYREKTSQMIKTEMGVHCFFEDFQKHLPKEYKHLTQAQWLVLSRANRFAPYWKSPISQRDKPRWSRSDVSVWFQVLFAKTHPEALASLLADNFPVPSIPKADRAMMQPRNRKPKGGRDRKNIPMRDPERNRADTVMNRRAKKTFRNDK